MRTLAENRFAYHLATLLELAKAPAEAELHACGVSSSADSRWGGMLPPH